MFGRFGAPNRPKIDQKIDEHMIKKCCFEPLKKVAGEFGILRAEVGEAPGDPVRLMIHNVIFLIFGKRRLDAEASRRIFT